MGRIQTGRLENFVRRWASIKGGGSVLSETLNEVFPVLDLENLTPENLLLAGIQLVAGESDVTGGVAQNGGVQIQNPVGSGNLLVVTKAAVLTGTTQLISYGASNALFVGAGATSRNRDTRNRDDFNGAALIRTNTNANTEFHGRLRVSSAENLEITDPNALAVLAPGTGFTVVSVTNNTLIRVSFFAYLRRAEPSELSF